MPSGASVTLDLNGQSLTTGGVAATMAGIHVPAGASGTVLVTGNEFSPAVSAARQVSATAHARIDRWRRDHEVADSNATAATGALAAGFSEEKCFSSP